MEIKEICNGIIAIYEETSEENQDRSLAVQLIYKLRLAINKEKFTDKDLVPILETTKKIAVTKKKLKQILEKELLSLISFLPHKLWMKSENELKSNFNRNKESREAKIANLLVTFAKEIYEIKLDRDAFSGKRKGYAVQILESISNYFDTPEFMELCSKSLKSKSKNEFLDSIESLKDYCLENDKIPTEELISIIDKRIEKTKYRTEATSGLNLQVEIGIISEFEALSRIDKWKEKNEKW